jgi:hypothetical protein
VLADLRNRELQLPNPKERLEMLDYRIHYAVLAAEDRVRSTRGRTATEIRGVRRIFRLGDPKLLNRDAGRR